MGSVRELVRDILTPASYYLKRRLARLVAPFDSTKGEGRATGDSRSRLRLRTHRAVVAAPTQR